VSHYSSVSNLSRNEWFVLDAIGNTTIKNSDMYTGTEQYRFHNQQNELLLLTDLDGDGVASDTWMLYDSNGNMTRDQYAQVLRYDAWNRQVDQTGDVSYRYDGLGRRVRENGRTIYYNDSWQALEERITATGALTEQYVWSPAYIDAMIRRHRDTDSNGLVDQTVHVTYDANFNITSIVTATAQVPTVVERFQYDTYGRRDVMSATWTFIVDGYAFRHGFAGGKLDLLTGRTHFRNRDYDPTLGRWIARDPIGYEGSPYNLYEYVEGNPLRYTDPTGLTSFIKDAEGYPAEVDRSKTNSTIMGKSTIKIKNRSLPPFSGVYCTRFTGLLCELYACMPINCDVEIGMYRIRGYPQPPSWRYIVSCDEFKKMLGLNPFFPKIA
jgi:RHS repeat-associated protein